LYLFEIVAYIYLLKRGYFIEGNEKMFAQEDMGSVPYYGGGVFRQEWLQKVQTSHRFNVEDMAKESLKFVVTVVDPSGGGLSNTALVTIGKGHNDHIVLLGVAAASTKTQIDVSDLTRTYLENFAAHAPDLRVLPHFLCVENNYGGGLVANNIAKMARSVIPSLTEYRTNPERPGVVTTNEVKRTAVMTVTRSLHTSQVQISSALFSQSGGSDHKETQSTLEEFFTQIRSLRQETTGNGETRYTAKDKNMQQDDMCFAFLIAAHHAVLLDTSLDSLVTELA
jgi:hypothetical protein